MVNIASLPSCDLFRAIFALVGVGGDHDLESAIARGAVQEMLPRVTMERGSIIWEQVGEKRSKDVLGRFILDGVLVVEIGWRGCRGGR